MAADILGNIGVAYASFAFDEASVDKAVADLEKKIQTAVKNATKGLDIDLKIDENTISKRLEVAVQNAAKKMATVGLPVQTKVAEVAKPATQSVNVQPAVEAAKKIAVETAKANQELGEQLSLFDKISVSSSNASEKQVEATKREVEAIRTIREEAKDASVALSGMYEMPSSLSDASIRQIRNELIDNNIDEINAGRIADDFADVRGEVERVKATIVDFGENSQNVIAVQWQMSSKWEAEGGKPGLSSSRLADIKALIEQSERKVDSFKKTLRETYNLSDEEINKMVLDVDKLSAAFLRQANQMSKNEEATVKMANSQKISLTKYSDQLNDTIEKMKQAGAPASKIQEGLDLIDKINSKKIEIKGVPLATSEMQGLALEVKEFQENAEKAGDTAETLGHKIVRVFSEKFGYGVMAFLAKESREALSDVYNNVVAIDSAMTELRKVTNETANSYKRFLDESAASARELGVSMTDLITATADFARLGYNLPDASELARVATVYKNVADGIDNIDIASESITSTLQAFGINAADAMSIVDKFNEVGNTAPINQKGIGDALVRSASALKVANNTLDESIALITAANAVTQDPEKVGRFCPAA